MKAVYEQALKRARSNFDPTRAKDKEAQGLAKSAAKQAEADPASKAVEKEAKRPRGLASEPLPLRLTDNPRPTVERELES